MDSQGQRGSNPKAMLTSLVGKRQKLQEELRTIEKQPKEIQKFQLEDRLFSLSSVTSPAAEELGIGREDGKSDMGQGRPKGGALATNGPGKPKKGRTGPRDGKKFRLSSDLDPDDEDDPDMSLR